MDDLNALFDSVDGLKDDLVEYGTVAAGAIAANMAWNYAVAKFVPATLDPTLRTYGLPVAAIIGGIALGRVVARTRIPQAHRLGLGVTFGLVTAGITSLAKTLAPSLPIAGLGGPAPLYGFPGLGRAPMSVEQQNGLGTVAVEEQSLHGSPYSIEEVSGFASVMQ